MGYDMVYIKNSERVSSAVLLPQRVGEGVSPTERACVNIPRELPAERIFLLGTDGCPPLAGRRMMVRANRWYSEV